MSAAVLDLLPLIELYGAWMLLAIGVVLMWTRRPRSEKRA